MDPSMGDTPFNHPEVMDGYPMSRKEKAAVERSLRHMDDGQRVEKAGGIVGIGPECFALKDGSVLSWRGENYVPQRPTLRVRLHNWRVRRQSKKAFLEGNQ